MAIWKDDLGNLHDDDDGRNLDHPFWPAGMTKLTDAEVAAARALPPPTVADIRAEASRRLQALAAAYSNEERETWSQQVREASALALDENADAPFLRARAASRGQDVRELAATVLQKDAALAAARGAILGAQDTIAALTPLPADYADDSRWPPRN